MKAGGRNNSAFDLIVAALQKDRNAEYTGIKAKAEGRGLTVYPVMFGRAKAMLGLVPTKKRTEAGKRRPGRPSKAGRSKSDRIRELLASGMEPAEIAKTVSCSRNLVYAVKSKGVGRPRKAARRGPGRPMKAGRGPGRLPKLAAPLAAVQDLVSNLTHQARENRELRETLERIGEMVDRVTPRQRTRRA